VAGRIIQIAVLVALVLAGLYALGTIYAFSQHRFFTVDEYQYGHATWLVAQGQRPYVDFFEHLFPLSFAINAPFFWIVWSFPTAALLLRKIVFFHLAALAVVSGAGCYALTRSPYASLLSSFVPLAFGFSLMSAIDYRPENFAACYFAVSLLLLEWNRRRRSVAVAIASGALALMAAFTMQKIAVLAAGTFSGMLAIDGFQRWLRASGRRSGGEQSPFVAHPVAFVATAALLGTVVLAVIAALGMLPAGFEATILNVIEHEKHYGRFSIFEKGYVDPFWSATRWSTVPILVFALGYLATREGRFWILPIGLSVAGGLMQAAPYPYTFFFLCYATVLVSVRGFARAIEWLQPRIGKAGVLAPLLHCLAVLALVDQLDFVAGRTTNEHQLRVLQKIEAFGSPAEAVIDNAGGAMFSNHASYYYYHGDAHREMFKDYFEEQLLLDYKRSQALFWIRDMRSRKLPQPVRDYLESHYVRADGDLHVLGFREAPTQQARRTRTIDVIRPGNYFVHRVVVVDHTGALEPLREARPGDVLIDGRPLKSDSVWLEAKSYEITLRRYSAGYVISPMPASFFVSAQRGLHYSMMFEYE
jgi:hypothetical protein